MTQAYDRLKELLRELFQFDSADLDLGIYRIMNQKRAEIEHFIEHGLPKVVEEALSSGLVARQSALASELEEKAEQIRQVLAPDAIGFNGQLGPEWHSSQLGKEYLELRARAEGAVDREELEATIFNHVYTFFGRYYDSGDFLSKRRYSRRQRYTVPYNGEEVYLHWANADQYYVKTAEHFTDYRYKAPNGVTVRFELVAATTEQNNVKGEKRFFVPCVEVADYDEESSTLIVPFEYRPLTVEEEAVYGSKNQQEKLIAEAVEDLPIRFQKQTDPLAALVSKRQKNAKGEAASLLEHHLRRYTRRNTSDFFVHKNLKSFLEGELDFFLKNEVLDVEGIRLI